MDSRRVCEWQMTHIISYHSWEALHMILILELQRELWIVESYLMLVLVFRMLRYWRMSGKVIRRSALRNLRPIQVLEGRIMNSLVLLIHKIKSSVCSLRSLNKLSIAGKTDFPPDHYKIFSEIPCVTKLISKSTKKWMKIPVQINRYKWRWDGEVVHKGVEFQHEPKLVRGSDELKDRYIVEDLDYHVSCVTRMKK